jgi:hypothetical protein
MVESFPRRLVVATGASASLFIATFGCSRLAQLAGLAKNPWEGDQDHPDLQEIATTAAFASAVVGVSYALVRPLLPRQTELAGLLYGIGSGFAIRLQINAILGFVGREPRKIASPSKLVGDAVFGLWLAETERLFA